MDDNSPEPNSPDMPADHSHQNLRRRSFRDAQLARADFEGADLRGADFTGADLRGARLCSARLGVSPMAGAAVLVLSLLLSVAAGIAVGLSIDAVRERLYGGGWERPSSAAGMLLVLAAFMVSLFWKGLDAAIKVTAAVFAVVFAVSLVVRLIWGNVEVAVAARGIGLALMLTLAILTGVLGRVVGGSFGAWAIAMVAVVGGLAAGRVDGGLAALVLSVSMVIVSKRALRGDQRDDTIRRLADRITRRWGTRFNGADLTGADFSGADAQHCDVTGATIDGVRWTPGGEPLSITRSADQPA